MLYSDEHGQRKRAKLERRTAKAALTRAGNWLNNLIESERLASEEDNALDQVKECFKNLVVKHESYTQLIENYEDFEVEEKWLGECQNYFMGLEGNAHNYVRHLEEILEGKGKQPLAINKQTEEIVVSEQSPDQSNLMINIESTGSGATAQIDEPNNSTSGEDSNLLRNSNSLIPLSQTQNYGFKLEKTQDAQILWRCAGICHFPCPAGSI